MLLSTTALYGTPLYQRISKHESHERSGDGVALGKGTNGVPCMATASALAVYPATHHHSHILSTTPCSTCLVSAQEPLAPPCTTLSPNPAITTRLATNVPLGSP